MSGKAAKADTREEIMEAALDLLYERGYERTTIQDIVDAVGVSKGAFYHHFTSKEDLVLTVARDFSGRVITMLEQLARRRDLDAVQKLNRGVQLTGDYKEARQRTRTRIKAAVPAFLRDRLFREIRDRAVVPLEKIIAEGIDTGQFGADNPEQLAEFLLLALDGMNASVENMAARAEEEGWEEATLRRQLVQKLSFYEEALDRVFCVSKSSFALQTPYLRRLLADGSGETGKERKPSD